MGSIQNESIIRLLDMMQNGGYPCNYLPEKINKCKQKLKAEPDANLEDIINIFKRPPKSKKNALQQFREAIDLSQISKNISDKLNKSELQYIRNLIFSPFGSTEKNKEKKNLFQFRTLIKTGTRTLGHYNYFADDGQSVCINLDTGECYL